MGVRELRRLAKKDREDVYASRRDYQTISQENSLRLQAKNGHIQLIELTKTLQSNKSGIGGIGGYVRTDVSTEISVSVTIKGMKLLSESFTLSNVWSRLGLAFPLEAEAKLRLEMRPTRPVEYIDVWGLDAGAFTPPKLKQSAAFGVADLNSRICFLKRFILPMLGSCHSRLMNRLAVNLLKSTAVRFT